MIKSIIKYLLINVDRNKGVLEIEFWYYPSFLYLALGYLLDMLELVQRKTLLQGDKLPHFVMTEIIHL